MKRMVEWLDARPESPGKALAKRVAEAWLRDGEKAAKNLFLAETKELVLWEKCAVADMVAAYREKLS